MSAEESLARIAKALERIADALYLKGEPGDDTDWNFAEVVMRASDGVEDAVKGFSYVVEEHLEKKNEDG